MFEVVDEVSEVAELRLEALVICDVRDFRHDELQVQFIDGCIVFDGVSLVEEGMDC